MFKFVLLINYIKLLFKIYKLLNLYNIVNFIHLYILNFILVRVLTLI